MKTIKQHIFERLILSKEKNNFATLYNLMKKIKSVNLDSCFTGDKKDLNKTHIGGSVYVIVYNKKQDNTLVIWCASKSGEVSDIETIKNNDELYEFLSSRLVNCTPQEFINIVIDYLQNNPVQENINERLVLSKHGKNVMYDELFKKLQEWSPKGYNDVYFDRIYDKTIKVKINGTEYDLESIGWHTDRNCVELSSYPSTGETALTFWFIENDDDIIKYLGGDDEDEIFAKQCVKKLIDYINLRIKFKNKI